MANDKNQIELSKVCKTHANDERPGRFPFTTRRYQQLAAEGVFPKVVKGKIDFVAAAFAVASYYHKMLQGGGSLALTDERAGLTAIKKEREGLKLEVEKGNLVNKDWALQMISLVVSEARTALLGLPRRLSEVLAVQNDPREIQVMLKKDVMDILNNLSRNGKEKVTNSEIVAQKARETFEAIRELRKEMPQDRKWQRDKLEVKIKQLQDEWWEDVKQYFE
jgi:hypothetical protein